MMVVGSQERESLARTAPCGRKILLKRSFLISGSMTTLSLMSIAGSEGDLRFLIVELFG